MTPTPGQAVLVRQSRAPARPAEVVEMRSDRKVRVSYTDERGGTEVVLVERCSAPREAALPGARTAAVHRALMEDAVAYREAIGDAFGRLVLPALRAVPKPPKPMRSQAYMRYVREHRCCRCASPREIEAHHFGEHGMSVKPDDFRCVPLCVRCHREFHDTGVLAPLSREGTEALFLDEQARLLRTWMKDRDITASRIYVDACLAVLREERGE